MREKAVWLTEGVTLSGALRGGTVCGHTLESAILAAEGVRIADPNLSGKRTEQKTHDF